MGRKTMVHEDGTLKPATVCPACFAESATVTPPRPVTVAPSCKACKRELSCYCESCAGRVGEQVRELTAQNIALREREDPRIAKIREIAWAVDVSGPDSPSMEKLVAFLDAIGGALGPSIYAAERSSFEN